MHAQVAVGGRGRGMMVTHLLKAGQTHALGKPAALRGPMHLWAHKIQPLRCPCCSLLRCRRHQPHDQPQPHLARPAQRQPLELAHQSARHAEPLRRDASANAKRTGAKTRSSAPLSCRPNFKVQHDTSSSDQGDISILGVKLPTESVAARQACVRSSTYVSFWSSPAFWSSPLHCTPSS